MEKQHTIAKSVSLSGTGLHTGQSGILTFRPANPNHGIKFRRVDLYGKPLVNACVENVVDTSRGTTIAQNGVKIYTVEHILASLRGSGIDNVVIDLDVEEPPILDGSAKIMMDALKSVGIVEQEAERRYLKINKKITYHHPKVGCILSIEPDDHFSIDVKVEYNSSVLNVQEAHLHNLDEFENEFAPCRTFVFFQELEMLLSHNLIKGGDLSNAIVFVEKEVTEDELRHVAKLFNREMINVHEGGILNNASLYFENEPARHKLLDIVGDLTLLGTPILGHVTAYKPGHFANTEFVKEIKKRISK